MSNKQLLLIHPSKEKTRKANYKIMLSVKISLTVLDPRYKLSLSLPYSRSQFSLQNLILASRFISCFLLQLSILSLLTFFSLSTLDPLALGPLIDPLNPLALGSLL